MNHLDTLSWQTPQGQQQALWLSLTGLPAPKRILPIDDTCTADVAYRLACEGTSLLWQGDFQNAKQMLKALAKRIDTPPKRKTTQITATAFPLVFHQHRHKLAQRANVLNKLLLPLNADFVIPLRRAPDVADACEMAYGVNQAKQENLLYLTPMRELLGLIGAYEWRKQGVYIDALAARIYPSYGVFSPVRGEYLDLIANAPLPDILQQQPFALDVGTGSGVIAAILAKRGLVNIDATDQDPRAIKCAQQNIQQLGYSSQVKCIEADLFPSNEKRYGLIVCNPPWIPAKPSSPIEYAVYDPDSRMLKNFLNAAPQSLHPQGEVWLIISDLAEHLQLRSRENLFAWIEAAGLQILSRHDTLPVHRKAQDKNDPLYEARKKEVTSLWRLSLADKQ